MTVALLARCDGGGLASMTVEVHRHLRPARTLLIDLGDRGRGDCSVDAYVAEQRAGMEIYQTEFAGGLPTRAIEWVTAAGVDTLWSAEILYDDDRVLRAARANGVRVVVHAMPELAPWATTALHPPAPSAPRPEIVVPTAWRADSLPGATVLPVPVARDRLPFRHRTNVERLYHVTGAAMLDRNGTQLLLAALPLVTRDCELIIRTERDLIVPAAPHVDVTIVRDRVANYWETVPAGTDLLVLPRRYGGLCLPIQECASLGIPTLALDADPYHRGNAGFVSGVNTTRAREHRMKGGMVPVYDASPAALAWAIDQAIADPERHARQSSAADAWAEAHAWDGPLGAQWCDYLNAECERTEEAA